MQNKASRSQVTLSHGFEVALYLRHFPSPHAEPKLANNLMSVVPGNKESHRSNLSDIRAERSTGSGEGADVNSSSAALMDDLGVFQDSVAGRVKEGWFAAHTLGNIMKS